jgi:hypothetical protein
MWLNGCFLRRQHELNKCTERAVALALEVGNFYQRVQELMRVVEAKEPNGTISTMDQVIVPKIKSAAYFPIPLCQSCQLS